MKFDNTDPVEFPVDDFREYYISATAGDLTVRRKTEDGSWVIMSGSPVSDGEEKLLITETFGGKIQVTPSGVDTYMSLGPIKK